MISQAPQVPMNDRRWRELVFRWMGVALILHLIASWFSLGHHSVDEYFQILEFLSYKRGVTPAYDLPSEFREQMRPWMQPYLYGLMVRAWEFAGVHNPFTWAWSMRLLTGLVGWASAVGLALRARQWFSDPRAQRFCVLALALIWFFPALHARPSSESLSGSAFLLGLVLLTGTRPRWYLGGALLGLSFEARFQAGFMVVGLVAWLVLMARAPLRKLALAFVGFCAVFAAGRLIDHWGYGTWAFSPWRYVEFNLVRGEVNRFGQAPPWDVFRMSFTESWPFIGLALAIASIVAWVRHPRHPLTWALVPFFMVHEVIAHKELRFFFPIALAGPALLTMSFVSGHTGRFLDPDAALAGWTGQAIRWFWRFLLLNNFIALIALLILPFSRPVQFYKKVWDLIPPGSDRFEIWYKGADPYRMLGNPVYFYRHPALVTREFGDHAELLPRVLAGETLWVFDPGFFLPPEAKGLERFCKPAIQTLPPWATSINFNGWLERAHPWTLFRCENRQD